MGDFKKYFYFDYAEVTIEYFFIYFVIAAIIAGYLTFKSNSKYKIELFFMSFYLLTGNVHNLLIIKIPGFDLQPLRIVYLLLGLLLVRKMFFDKSHQRVSSPKTVPWYELALIGYLIFVGISVVLHSFPAHVGTIIDGIAFLLIIKGLGIMADKAFYDIIGKCIIITAIFSSVISILQVVVDPYFMRIGNPRTAFGNVLRANGLFSTEYYNAYFLIIAITWALTTVKKKIYSISLVILFSIGVLCTFMRMSWLILALVLFTYLVFIRKTALEKLMTMGLSILVLSLSISIFYYQDIMNSTIVKERLSDTIDGRIGYYNMVLETYQKKPFFGYGGRDNETYYTQMLLITGSRARAEGSEGGIHNGYLETLFYYGVPALIFYCLFIILSVYYYATFIKENFYFVIPFLIGIIVLICNFTNSFHLLSHPFTMYAIHMGIGLGLRNLSKQATEQKELVDISKAFNSAQ